QSVQLEPQFRGDPMPQRTRAFTRRADTTTDRGRVLVIEGVEGQNRGLIGAGVTLLEDLAFPSNGQQRSPRLRVLRRTLNQQMVVDVDQARAPLRAFEVTRGPEQVVGDSSQHQTSTTQVSLLPPPCEEFTIKDPSRSATRVRPPGSTRAFDPSSTNGRRSTWRGTRATVEPCPT